jgi:hypothetical protein
MFISAELRALAAAAASASHTTTNFSPLSDVHFTLLLKNGTKQRKREQHQMQLKVTFEHLLQGIKLYKDDTLH